MEARATHKQAGKKRLSAILCDGVIVKDWRANEEGRRNVRRSGRHGGREEAGGAAVLGRLNKANHSRCDSGRVEATAVVEPRALHKGLIAKDGCRIEGGGVVEARRG